MESSSTPQTNYNPQISPTKEGDPSQEQSRKRTTGFSRESLLSNLQEITKEADEIKQELPEESILVDTAAIKRQVEALDKKQIWWIWMFRGWLVFYIWEYVYLAVALASHELGQAGGLVYAVYMLYSIGSVLILTVKYLVQLMAMFKKSLKLNNIALKIMVISACLGLMKVTFLLLTLYDYGLYQKMADEVISQIRIPGVLEFRLAYPSKTEHKIVVLAAVGEWLLDFVLTYGGARLYKRYLVKREYLLKQKIE